MKQSYVGGVKEIEDVCNIFKKKNRKSFYTKNIKI